MRYIVRSRRNGDIDGSLVVASKLQRSTALPSKQAGDGQVLFLTASINYDQGQWIYRAIGMIQHGIRVAGSLSDS